jgi:methylmalonyl-CoA/ethylmalonyl-CoA epimerase
MTFHHIGVACRDLDRELRALAALGYSADSEPFVDPLQRIRGLFVSGPGPRLELLAPAGDASPVTIWLERGIRMYHQAYEVDNLSDAIARFVAGRAIVVSPPTPAVAFGNREVAFLMLPNMQLIELISTR